MPKVLSPHDIGVVYLCRSAEGERPVHTFVNSYRTHQAGIAHDLHIVFKGFRDPAALANVKTLFSGLSINPIELDDTGFDIGSYFAAARAVKNRRLIFFNTFTEILTDDWLKKFDKASSSPGVGLVGATGSWQSHCSAYELHIQRIWHLIAHPASFIKARPASSISLRRRSKWRLLRSIYILLRVDRYITYRYQYRRFPNPHIRTNAFMIERDRLLSLKASSFKTKSAAYKFESGWRSLTAQIMSCHLRPVVVDRNGEVHDIPDWKSSSTFWSDQQANLIVADNRTRDYSEGGQDVRAFLQWNAWEHPWSGIGKRRSSASH
jgi:hypothetical protein